MEFLGWYENDDYVAIVMELIEHGDLAGYLNHRPKPESEAREISWQILNGLEVMHRYGFAHRDLKPAVCSSLPPPRASLRTANPLSCLPLSVEHLHILPLSQSRSQNRRFRHLETHPHRALPHWYPPCLYASPHPGLHARLRRPRSGPERSWSRRRRGLHFGG